jgi:serine/threonine protein kinase
MNANLLQLEAVFHEALAKSDAAERTAFLESACAGNAELRERLDALLAAHAERGEFLGGTDGATVKYAGQLDASAIGTLIASKYKLLEVIGEGGMGTVYMAEQIHPVRRKVAVKIIRPGMDSKGVLARFEAERQALALMDHPHIARVLDAGTTEQGLPFFVMELVKGTPITKFCDERTLSPRERLELFVPVCQAIQHAHQKGVIHRDIKPSNVLVALYDECPIPKVIDFGVAKATGQALTELTLHTGFGSIIGTPEYMSPEQASFNQLDIDTRSDIYALGVMLYELLTGTTPVDKTRLKQAAVLEVLRVVREEEPPRPSVKLSTLEAKASVAATRRSEPRKLSRLLRGELDWIVMKALEKDRRRRYDSASAFAADINRFLANEFIEARPPSAWYRFRKMVRRNNAALTTGALLAVTLLLGMGICIWQAARAGVAEQAARMSEKSAQAQKRKAEEAEARALSERDSAVAERVRAEKAERRALAEAGIAHSMTADLTKQVGWRQHAEVEPSLVSLVANLREARGLADADVLLALKSLATCRVIQMKFKDAEPVLVDLVEGRKQFAGDRHPATIDAMIELGSTLNWLDKNDEAERVLRRALELSEDPLIDETIDAGHDQAAWLKGNAQLALSTVISLRGAVAEAARLNADGMSTLGSLKLKQGAATDMEKILQSYVPMLETKIPEDWRLFDLKSLQGACLSAQNMYAEAEPLLLKGYEGLEQRTAQIPDASRDRVRAAIQRLVELYQAWGKPETAAAWRTKLETSPSPSAVK